jgi:urease accessory protein
MIGKLQIHAGLKADKTYLKSCFFTTPFKIANVTENKQDRCLQLMLMSSSPGVLDGDDFEITVRLDDHCSLKLQTQSYQRFFSMKNGARQKMEVHVGAGACFCYVPHPSVPHAGSDFAASNKIYLSAGATVMLGEVLTCGRKLSGEEFRFTGYQNMTEIFRNGRLAVKENLVIKPGHVDIHSIGHFEGYSHQAGFIFIDPTADISQITSEIQKMLQALPGICFGVSSLPVNGLIVRLLGNKGEQLYDCLLLLTGIFSVSGKLQV